MGSKACRARTLTTREPSCEIKESEDQQTRFLGLLDDTNSFVEGPVDFLLVRQLRVEYQKSYQSPGRIDKYPLPLPFNLKVPPTLC